MRTKEGSLSHVQVVFQSRQGVWEPEIQWLGAGCIAFRWQYDEEEYSSSSIYCRSS